MKNDLNKFYIITIITVVLFITACSISLVAVKGDSNFVEIEQDTRSDAQLKMDSLRLIEMKKSKQNYKFPEKYD